MKERRFKDQYRIVTDVDPRTGRPREVAEYAGEYYSLPQPGRQAGRILPWILLYWAAALAYLSTSRATGRCMYALVPFMLGLFPGCYAAMGLWALWHTPERMTVVQREKGLGRVLRSALGCCAFGAAGAVGCSVYLSLNHLWAAGWHEPVLCALASAAAGVAFAGCRKAWNALEKA